MYEVSEREKMKHANDRIQAKMFDDLKEKKINGVKKHESNKNYDRALW